MELKQFNELVSETFELREQKARHEDLSKQIQEQINEKEKIIQAYLEENELTRFDSTKGLVFQVVKKSIKRLDETKIKEELMKRGDYEAMAKVNTQTLQAYIVSEIDRVGTENFNFKGVEINEYVKLSYRRK
jgi:hypothetical protein